MAVNHVQPARMPVSPKRLERSRYPPSTKFGKLVNVDGSANIHSIDWTRVALKEPQNVSDWIVYLHNNESPAIHSLLRRVQETLDEIVANSQYMEQWRIYAQSHLPLILMDIVLDRKMFSPDPNVFTDLEYSLDVLSVFGRSVALLNMLIETGRSNKSQLSTNIIGKMKEYCDVMWRNRHLLVTPEEKLLEEEDARGEEDFGYVSYQATKALVMLHRTVRDDRLPSPIEMYAPQFLLRCWTYAVRRREEEQDILGLLHSTSMDSQSPWREFIESAIFGSGDPNFPRHLIIRICHRLRDENVVGEETGILLNACGNLIATGWETLYEGKLSGPTGLLPSMIVACQRDLCGPHAGTEIMSSVLSLVCNVSIYLSAVHDGSHTELAEEFFKYAGKFNLIALVSKVLIHSVKENNEDTYAWPPVVLDFTIDWHETLGMTSEAANLWESSKRVWHDTLKSLTAIQTRDVKQVRMKISAIRTWRKYGAFLGLQENKNVTTLNVPSTKIDAQLAYFKIPRRCSWPPCACSFGEVSHHIRVCKGCWRVLYCNEKCQRSDWKAGHRLVCRSE